MANAPTLNVTNIRIDETTPRVIGFTEGEEVYILYTVRSQLQVVPDATLLSTAILKAAAASLLKYESEKELKAMGVPTHVAPEGVPLVGNGLGIVR